MTGEVMRERLWTERRIDSMRETEFLLDGKICFILFLLCWRLSDCKVAGDDSKQDGGYTQYAPFAEGAGEGRADPLFALQSQRVWSGDESTICEMASVEQWWNEPCSYDDLCKISRSVADWKAVAPFLGLTMADQEGIIGYAPFSVEVQRTNMLRRWKERFGTGATYRKLADAFKMCERQDLVDELWLLVTGREKTPPTDIQPSIHYCIKAACTK